MFEIDPNKSYKELIAQVNKDELPKEVQVNMDKVAVAEGIDSVTGSSEEVKDLFAAIEKYYPKALAGKGEAAPQMDEAAQTKQATDLLELALEFEDDEEEIANINAALELVKLAASFPDVD